MREAREDATANYYHCGCNGWWAARDGSNATDLPYPAISAEYRTYGTAASFQLRSATWLPEDNASSNVRVRLVWSVSAPALVTTHGLLRQLL